MVFNIISMLMIVKMDDSETEVIVFGFKQKLRG